MNKPASKMPQWKKPHLPRLSKTQIVLLAIGLLVVFMAGRALLGGFRGGAVDVTGQGGNTESGAPAPSTRGPAAEVEGHMIPGAGPVAVLNPGLAQPGARIGVEGSGFDPGAGVDVFLTAPNGQPASVASGTADKAGAFKAEFGFPTDAMNAGPSLLVTVRQQDSDKEAKADLVVRAGAGLVTVSENTAAPGSTITVDAEGFLPGEQINAFWGAASGTPSTTLTADEAGRAAKAPVKVGLAPAGNSTLILVGDKSKTTAAAPITMLSLYPTAATEPFAAKAGEAIGITGGGFAPDERVLVHFNESTGPPALVLQAGPDGGLAASDFKVPFGLTGQHTLILTGEQSRASVTSGFMVLPYTPLARAGTYGGLPGTVLNFYVRDFAPKEVVKVYTGADANNAGVLVAAFRVDERGAASAAGSYVIPGDAQGELGFKLVGSKSQASADATVTVDKVDGPVNVPSQPPYVLPPELSD
jgi:hypothetical protein